MKKSSRLPALAVAFAFTAGTAMPIAAFAQAAAPRAGHYPATGRDPGTGGGCRAWSTGPPPPPARRARPTPRRPPPGTPPAPGAAPGTPGAPDATAAAAPGAPPAPGAPGAGVDQGNGTEAVDNPYGLSALWKTGDAVSHTVLVLLAIMSLGTWYIMITKFWEQGRLFSAGRIANKEFWRTASVRDGVQRAEACQPVPLRGGKRPVRHRTP